MVICVLDRKPAVLYQNVETMVKKLYEVYLKQR